MKRLYRSEDNKVIAGVCGGLGEYFDMDPVVIRVIAVVLLILTGIIPIALIYVLMILVVPKQRAPYTEVMREVGEK